MKKIVGFLALTVLMASCKVGPKYAGRDFEVAEGFSVHDSLAFETDSVNSDSLAFVVEDLRWWEFFNDPVLDSLIREGLANNQDLLISAKQIEIAQYQLGIQKAELLPGFDVGVDGSYGNSSFFSIQNGEDLGQAFGAVNMNWEIDFWGKYRRLNEAARADLLATEFGYRSLALSLIETIASTYFEYLAAQSQVEISKRNAASRDSMMLIIQARYDEGLVPEIDLNQSQIQYAIAASAVPQYERQVIQTRNLLNFLVGRAPGPIRTTNVLESEELEVEIPVLFPIDVLAQRPDVRAAEQNLVAQNAFIGVAQANRLPSISISALIGAGTLSNGFISPDQVLWSAGGGLLFPLFNFGQLKKQVEVERKRTEQTEFEYRKTVLNAWREVEDALAAIDNLEKEIDITIDRVDAAMNAEYLSRERYDKGVTSYLEFLESQRQAFEAELTLSARRSELLGSYVRLYAALGGGWLSEQESQPEDPSQP
ncbi:efflux transporter outer membrane subunit [Cryomorphaceae bacterium]|nr:efflux transporter outer membrane subunit [Cryomorphaceae bacterium]